MEESMILGMGDAVEESIEAGEYAEDLPSSSADSEAEVEVETDESDTDAMAAASSDSVLSDLRALKGILEALLFVTADPIPVTRFLALLGAVTKHEVEQALTSLSHDYEQEGRGLQLAEVAGGYRIMTKAEFAPWLKRLEKVKAHRNSPVPPWSHWRSLPTSNRSCAPRSSKFEGSKHRASSGHCWSENLCASSVGRKNQVARSCMGRRNSSSNILGCVIYRSCRRFVSSGSWASPSRRCCRLTRPLR